MNVNLQLIEAVRRLYARTELEGMYILSALFTGDVLEATTEQQDAGDPHPLNGRNKHTASHAHARRELRALARNILQSSTTDLPRTLV